MGISRHDDYGNKEVKLIHLFVIILEKLRWLNINKGTINGKYIFLQKIIIS